MVFDVVKAIVERA